VPGLVRFVALSSAILAFRAALRAAAASRALSTGPLRSAQASAMTVLWRSAALVGLVPRSFPAESLRMNSYRLYSAKPAAASDTRR
jgi:hypothetical protein